MVYEKKKRLFIIIPSFHALSSNWSGHHPFTVGITGSSPVGVTSYIQRYIWAFGAMVSATDCIQSIKTE